MKKIKLLFALMLLIACFSLNAQVAINKDGTNPDASSILHVKGDASQKDVLIQTGTGGGVGISTGTLIPTHLLHLYNTSTVDVLRLEGPLGSYGHGARLSFGDRNRVYIQEDLEDKLLLYGYNRTAIMGGNVGIGVLDPDASSILHIKGNVSQKDVLIQTGTGGGVGINTGTLNPTHLLHMYDSVTDNLLRLEGPLGANHHGARLNFGDRNNVYIQEDLDDKLLLYGDTRTAIMGGNVGIGVLDPDTELEVNGQVKITGGTPGADKVLTSDADGLASWEEATDVGPNYGTVVNPATGETWLDRNLGASQVATSSTDTAAYGDIYQWGRAQEGHEDRASATYGSQATDWFAGGSRPWDEKFITSWSETNWVSTDQDDLWKGRSAENNPCPSGFRIPTNAEWNQERRSWSSNDAAGAFASLLKITVGGYRSSLDGSFWYIETKGYYWSSTPTDYGARYLVFTSSNAFLDQTGQSHGHSVRCIKD